MDNRPHVEPIPIVTPARQADVTSPRGWIIFIKDYIDQFLIDQFLIFLIGEFRVEGRYVALKSFWALGNRL